MGYVLVSDYGVEGLKQRLQNIKWFFYKPGINDGANMGDDGLYSYIKSDNPVELENKLVNLWGLTQGKYCYYYKDILSLHFSADQKNGYLYIRLQKYNHLRDHLKDEDFKIVEKFDRVLDALSLEYYPFVYDMEPIYGENFKGKDILKKADKIKYPREEWITYSESQRRSQKRDDQMKASSNHSKASRHKGLFGRLKSLLGLDR